MASPEARYQTAADVVDSWREDVLTGKAPVLYPVSSGALSGIELGPGLVVLIGGPPGSGKSALVMQLVIDALRLTPELRAVVCNIEMPPDVLFDRQLARLSGVELNMIRYRQLESVHADRIDQAMNTLEPLAERLAFVRPPFDLANVAAAADDCRADLIVLDYIQRIRPPGQHESRRGSVDATMDYLRQFADAGVAVVVVAAVARTKDRYGRSSYTGDGLNLASFRESSELEFGADSAYILVPTPKDDALVTLRHLKARYTALQDVELAFDRPRQRFSSAAGPEGNPSSVDKGKLRAGLAALWNRTAAAPDDEDEDTA